MDETAAKQFENLQKELSAGYTMIVALLARLPIPVTLPARQADDPVWAVNALARAWELADWEPLPKLAVGRIRDMITAWLTAYELAVAAQDHGPARWRLRGIEDALLRVSARAWYIDRHLAANGR